MGTTSLKSRMQEVVDVLLAPRLMDSEVSSMITPVVLEVLAKAPQSAAVQVFLDFGWDPASCQFARPLERMPMAACILALTAPAEREPDTGAPSSSVCVKGRGLVGHLVPAPDAGQLKASEDYHYCSQCTRDDQAVKCEGCAATRLSDPATWSQQKLREELTKLAAQYHVPVPVHCTHDRLRELAQQHMLPDRVLVRLLEYADFMDTQQ